MNVGLIVYDRPQADYIISTFRDVSFVPIVPGTPFPVPVSTIIITTGCEKFPANFNVLRIPILVLGTSVDGIMGFLGHNGTPSRNGNVLCTYGNRQFSTTIQSQFMYDIGNKIVTSHNEMPGFVYRNYTCICFDITSFPSIISAFLTKRSVLQYR